MPRKPTKCHITMFEIHARRLTRRQDRMGLMKVWSEPNHVFIHEAFSEDSYVLSKPVVIVACNGGGPKIYRYNRDEICNFVERWQRNLSGSICYFRNLRQVLSAAREQLSQAREPALPRRWVGSWRSRTQRLIEEASTAKRDGHSSWEVCKSPVRRQEEGP